MYAKGCFTLVVEQIEDHEAIIGSVAIVVAAVMVRLFCQIHYYFAFFSVCLVCIVIDSIYSAGLSIIHFRSSMPSSPSTWQPADTMALSLDRPSGTIEDLCTNEIFFKLYNGYWFWKRKWLKERNKVDFPPWLRHDGVGELIVQFPQSDVWPLSVAYLGPFWGHVLIWLLNDLQWKCVSFDS